ncbi:MAG: hypothetical protein Q9174_002483 [Haloplaca sp. 1 TL-2023]
METIWNELAYPMANASSFAPPSIWKEQLEQFANQYFWTADLPYLTRLFLATKGVTSSHQQEDPQHRQDREKIEELVIKAFHIIRNVAEKNEATEAIEATEASQPSIQPKTSLASSIPTPEDKQVNGALAVNTIQSKFKIVAAVNKWIEEHPNLRVPVLSSYDSINLETLFATEATLTENGEKVWILRLGIVDLYQGWVLEKADGTSTLVKSQYTRKDGHAYYPWIGGEDFTFSDNMIADHKIVKKKIIPIRRYAAIKRLDPEDVLNRYDISKAALEDPTLEKPQAEVIDIRGDESDSPLSPLPDEEVVNNTSKKRKFSTPSRASRNLPGSDSDSSEPLIKKTSLRSSVKVNAAGPTIDSTSLGQGVPDADTYFPFGVLKPQKFTTPSRASRSQCQAQWSTPQQSILSAAYPTPETSQHSPDFHESIRRDRSLYAGLDLSPSYGNASLAQHSDIQSAHQHSNFSANRTTAKPFTIATAKPGQIKFHYFLADPTLGAMPHTYTTLPTKEKFFRDATTAYNTAASWTPGQKPNIVAASIKLAGMDTPLVVPVGKPGKDAWEEVKGCIEEMMNAGSGVWGDIKILVGG